MMTCKGLIEYLSRFDQGAGVGFVIVDTEKRLHHITLSYDLLLESPAVLLETVESEPLENIAEEVQQEGGSTS